MAPLELVGRRVVNMSKKAIALIATVISVGGFSLIRMSIKRSAYAAEDPQIAHAEKLIHQGRKTFRFDTFGDEAFWGDTLKLHEAIEGQAFGGVGPGLSPRQALSLGLKVDIDALLPE